MKRVDLVTFLGIISLTYWIIDVINNYFIHHTVWSLWISSVGIGLTAVSLLTRNTFMMTSLFCALFIVESFWTIGFFSHFFFKTSLMGLTDYLFDGRHSTTDFIITSYHIFMVPFLFIGILKEKIVHKKAWAGAALFAGVLCFFTYLLAEQHETINCVHSIEKCKPFLSFLENTTNPIRTALGVMTATLFLFIPTNYLLVKLGEKLNLSET